ncbi:hypothetical protein ES754_01050 [Psychrobacter frigidicola]|uniref:FimV N-terminal domain-containing protein n=1 Tax=Psychrobacter frigidicola TaxID=45611 RepID=A0A5C7A3F2_9GAMM|nr:hypothetical protein [Psychrobacter frigidicola]TXD97608.1 hypothetical protein ES754_01050 [Psychrobacter frigidicola]
MFWHLPHRLTTIYYTVSIALLYSVSSAALPSVAHAASFGKTMITSTQFEPLAASITVADISSADFTVGLASPTVYEQMGLTPTTSMSVRFVPTSADTGKVIINTTQPIALPFADMILTLNDKGQRNVMPKTLLLPLSKSVLTEQPNNSIMSRIASTSTTQAPSLVMNQTFDDQPLIVKHVTPPPLLFISSKASTSMQMQALTQDTAPNTEYNRSPFSFNLPPISASSIDMPAAPQTSQASNTTVSTSSVYQGNSLINSNTDTVISIDNQALTARNEQDPAELTTVRTIDQLLDVLTIQITRRIQLSNQKFAVDTTQSSLSSGIAEDLNLQSSMILAADSNDADAITDETITNKDAFYQQVTLIPQVLTPKAGSYTVQRNDNLWLISQYIAQKNNLNVTTTMAQIQNQNPEAFTNQDASQLKHKAQLNLSIYDVVPSQQSMQTAIAAQRQLQYTKAIKQQKAKRNKSTNSILGNYSKELPLQNQKLAKRNARLKTLRTQ